MTLAVDFALVRAVREDVSRRVRRTPLLRSEWLSSLTGRDVFLKCENLQVTGSFKVRGALAAVGRLTPEERRRGVVASSAGNHGLGLAQAAAVHGVQATVVVPRSAPAVKVDGIAALGARAVRSPHDGYDDTQSWTLENLDRFGGAFISPFEHPAVALPPCYKGPHLKRFSPRREGVSARLTGSHARWIRYRGSDPPPDACALDTDSSVPTLQPRQSTCGSAPRCRS